MYHSCSINICGVNRPGIGGGVGDDDDGVQRREIGGPGPRASV